MLLAQIARANLDTFDALMLIAFVLFFVVTILHVIAKATVSALSSAGLAIMALAFIFLT